MNALASSITTGPSRRRSRGVAIQPDGKIVVGAVYTSDVATGGRSVAAARLNADGSLDASFSSDGISTTRFGAADEGAWDVALQADGKVLVGGFDHDDLAVARFTAAGAVDGGFGASGVARAGFTTLQSFYQGLTVQADGKVLLAGTEIAGYDFAAARFTTARALDTSFDADGKLTTDLAAGGGGAWAAAVVADGRVTLSGGVEGHVAVARYVVASGLEERLHAQTDANHDVTSIAHPFGQVLERYAYDPYGSPTVLDADFTPGAGGTDHARLHYHQGLRLDGVINVYDNRRWPYGPARAA